MFIIFAELGINGVQHIDFWMEQYSHWQFDALHISVGSFCENLVFSGLYVVDDGLFEEWNFEIEAFSVDFWGKWAGEFIELDGIVSYID